MEPWNVCEIRPRYRKWPRLKAVVRTVRDWLNGFLGETEGIIPASRPTPRQPGPPEDWLRRVREGAPHLLQPADQMEIRQPIAPQEAMERAKDREMDWFRREPPRAPGISTPALAARPVEGPRRSPAHATSRLTSWFDLVRRQVKLTLLTGEEKQTKSPQQNPAHSPTRKERGPAIIGNAIQSDASSEGRPIIPAPQTGEHPSEQTAGHKASSVPGPEPWSERLSQGVKAEQHFAPANWPVSRSRFLGQAESCAGRDGSNDDESVFPQLREAPRPVSSAAHIRSAVKRLKADGDRLKSMRPTGFAGSDQPTPLQAAIPGRAEPAVTVATSAMWPNSRTWPSSPVGVHHPRSGAQKGSATDISWDTVMDKAIETLPLEEWPLAPGRWPEQNPSDPWPELPEDPPRANNEWAQFSRNAHRLSALDREQRGGR
jgi:hypothetical protein